MAPPKYKLLYFNSRGRAEPIRMIFAHCDVDFEDKRLTPDEWKEMKPSIPFNQLPALEVDGKVIVGQSMAIARYVARENGLAGKNNLDAAVADMYVDCTSDLIMKCIPMFYEKDEEKKAEIKAKLASETLPEFAAKFEKSLKDNGGKFFVGDELTYADICVAYTMDMLGNWISNDWKENAPELAAFMGRINELPKIKKWIETRPQTDH